jgi:hypothetical protein
VVSIFVQLQEIIENTVTLKTKRKNFLCTKTIF